MSGKQVWYTPPKWWSGRTGHQKMFIVLGIWILVVLLFIMMVAL